MSRSIPAPRLVSARVVENRVLGAGYNVLRFARTGEPTDANPSLDVRSGQFAMVRGAWGDAPLLPRPMSLLDGADAPSILVKVVGEGTRRMARASPGEAYTLLMPLGRPWADAARVGRETRALLVAGGVGVAPLLFLARDLAAAGAPRPIALYGARTAADLPLCDALAEVADVRVSTEDAGRGTPGRVTVLLDGAIADAPGATLFTCGPTGMMTAVTAFARERGLVCIASLEAPMACGYGVCLGCAVPAAGGGYLHVCTDGPCLDASRLAWGARP